MKQIIAIGGGGFTKKGCSLALERYILAQTKKENPKICFLPQASNESPTYILKFFESFLSLDAQPSWISLFGSVKDSWKEKLLQADIVYVGGGNTKSMIALWKAWGVDHVLKEAYNKGVVMAGLSAGMICWFEQGITDSMWPLGFVEGLGFLKGSGCPHFDSEVERQDVYKNLVASGQVSPGIALEDGVAAHFIDGKLFKIVTEIQHKKAFQITATGQEALKAEFIL